jgi:dihydroorotase
MRLLLLLFCTTLAWGQADYDLLLKGGRTIDPKNGIDGVRDVGIKDGRIAAVDASIDASRAERVVDVSGLVVTPGLIDIHVHVFHSTGIPGAWAGDNSVMPDSFSFRTGVTTLADAGSAGWRNFEQFRTTVIDRAQTRVLAFINIAGYGMVSNMVEQGDWDPEEVARLAKKHSDVVVGVKAAHYEGPGWESVDNAVAAGRLAGRPIMVDFGWFVPERPYWELVGEHLRPGDITTHAYRGPVPWIDKQGKLFPYLHAARKRGVIFDVGHGGGSFVFRNAVPAVKQGFYPDTISTDLHSGSRNSAMMDQPTTMSKFLAMGMPLADVIRASTWRAAQVLGHGEIGHLSVGAVADVTVLQVEEGDFVYRDVGNGRFTGRQRLHADMTLKDGAIVWDWNSRSAVDYKKLDPEYGVNPYETLTLPSTQ